MVAYGDSDRTGLDPAAVVPGNVRIVRDDSFAQEHELYTRARCDRYYYCVHYCVLLKGNPLGFVGVVERRVGEYPASYRPRLQLVAAGASEADRVAHINEFYPLAAFAGPQYEQVKRRGVGTKVMHYVLDDMREEGFRWAYVSLSARRELSRLLETLGFTPVDSEPVPFRYFRRL